MAWLVTPAEAGCCMVVPHKSCLRVLSLFPGLCAVQRLMSESLMHLMHNPGSALSSGQSGPLETHRRTPGKPLHDEHPDRKSTRLNSSHSQISYAVFCLKKKGPLPGRSSWSSTGATAKGPKNVATRSHARRTVVSRNDFQPDPRLSDSHRLKVVWELLSNQAYPRG